MSDTKISDSNSPAEQSYAERFTSIIKANPFKAYKEIVYEILRDDIISGVYPPHYKLVEYKLAEEFAISRTPVKQALNELANNGFIYTKPATGSYVASYDHTEFSDLLQVRYILERLACAQAAERATRKDMKLLFKCCVDMDKAYQRYGDGSSDIAEDAFHRHLIACSHNNHLNSAYKSIELQIMRFRSNVTKNWKFMEDGKKAPASLPYAHSAVEFDTMKSYKFKTQIGYEHYMIYMAIYNRRPESAVSALTYEMMLNNPDLKKY